MTSTKYSPPCPPTQPIRTYFFVGTCRELHFWGCPSKKSSFPHFTLSKLSPQQIQRKSCSKLWSQLCCTISYLGKSLLWRRSLLFNGGVFSRFLHPPSHQDRLFFYEGFSRDLKMNFCCAVNTKRQDLGQLLHLGLPYTSAQSCHNWSAKHRTFCKGKET